MASRTENSFISYPGFPYGLDNLSKENGVQQNALRVAVNIDLDDAGRPRRRKGYVRLDTGIFHSATEAFGYLFVIKDGSLLGYDENLSPTTLVEGLGDDLPLSYATLGERLFWTNGQAIGVITINFAAIPIWPATPAQPAVSIQGQIGGLRAGDYQVALTARDNYGRESGSTMATLVSVPEGGGILLNPLPFVPAGHTLRLYMSHTDEDRLYLARDIPDGLTQLLVGVSLLSKELDEVQQWIEPMPSGQVMGYAAGRLWVARGPVLFYSEPFRYGAMLPDNYIRMSSDITMIATAGEADATGLYVGTAGRTVYLAGPDPKAMQMTIARQAGAVAGTFRKVHTSLFLSSLPNLPETTAALWMSGDGVFCLGLPGGQVKPLTQTRMQMTENAEHGAIMLRQAEGLNQVVASVQGGVSPRAAASDELVGTIYRGGIAID